MQTIYTPALRPAGPSYGVRPPPHPNLGLFQPGMGALDVSTLLQNPLLILGAAAVAWIFLFRPRRRRR